MSHLKEYNVFYKLENGDIIDSTGSIRAYGKRKNTLIDALNLMDEYASETVRDNDNGEAQKLAKAYDLLYKHLTK